MVHEMAEMMAVLSVDGKVEIMVALMAAHLVD